MSSGSLDSAAISTVNSSVDILKAAENGTSTPAEAEDGKPDEKAATKLIKDEEKAEGRISRRALYSFFGTFGGPTYWFIYFALLVGGQALAAFQTFWLGLWAKAYERASDPADVSPTFWLGLYVVWVTLGLATTAISAIIYYVGATKASRVIHRQLVDRIFGSFMRFLDSTPVGRIIGRFTKDMKAIDGQFTDTACVVADMTVALVVRFLSAVAFIPLFSIPAIVSES